MDEPAAGIRGDEGRMQAGRQTGPGTLLGSLSMVL